MVKYLITYSGMGHPDPAEMEAARAAFGEWLASAGDAVVDPGAPVSYIGAVAAGTPTAAPEFSGYTIIEAETEEDVRSILSTHPFVARGGTLQINQSL
ncbi:hypothetical protein [Microbacterium candidum]|uniref:YCII-related domain-containing protein n=1 Tax=Microbacterium candidum TaxID=3041922 RepID=A0ABT7N026_9MICO|nr:hypothetical protein [Microbacterium sp. ASV49]MDL9980060.1 hypothetical protein [Microbacterium sp. ASV49]